MEIIAATKDGYLIQASRSEVKTILDAMAGARPKKLRIGQKIAVADYASTITKIKTLKENYYFTVLIDRVEKFNNHATALKLAVERASEIEI